MDNVLRTIMSNDYPNNTDEYYQSSLYCHNEKLSDLVLHDIYDMLKANTDTSSEQKQCKNHFFDMKIPHPILEKL